MSSSSSMLSLPKRLLVSWNLSRAAWHSSIAVVAAPDQPAHHQIRPRTIPSKYGGKLSAVTGGVSINCTVTSSQVIIPGCGKPRRKRVRRDSRAWHASARQGANFAGVGAADDQDRAGALRRDRILLGCSTWPVCCGTLRPLWRLADLGLEFDLHLFRGFVLRNLAEHHLEPAQFFVRRRRAAILFLSLRYCG